MISLHTIILTASLILLELWLIRKWHAMYYFHGLLVTCKVIPRLRESTSTKFLEETVKHALPSWLGSFKHRREENQLFLYPKSIPVLGATRLRIEFSPDQVEVFVYADIWPFLVAAPGIAFASHFVETADYLETADYVRVVLLTVIFVVGVILVPFVVDYLRIKRLLFQLSSKNPDW